MMYVYYPSNNLTLEYNNYRYVSNKNVNITNTIFYTSTNTSSEFLDEVFLKLLLWKEHREESISGTFFNNKNKEILKHNINKKRNGFFKRRIY